MNLKEIQVLITSVTDSAMLEFKLEYEKVKIVIKKNIEDKVTNIIPPVIVYQKDKVQEKSIRTIGLESKDFVFDCDSKYHIVKSPFIGTFHLQSSIDKSKYIKRGDMITKGDVLCSIEALKLLNEIKSNFSGKVVKILVEDFTPVEYNQSLYVIEL
ncbi:biotin/lipoyl-containing protein [Aquimarina sp. I32.4]|uniref:acetyl-CoA carboxylase biotin carboxyl carrier protein n=1 Tax=Aquimarina sp. I32.4 TaxID=2053903 RepID=UPI000CDED99F|nr:biotin/lipoyl-containing protein [Aquimarina sp. I32.4]